MMENGQINRRRSLYWIGVLFTITGYICIFALIVASKSMMDLLPISHYISRPIFCFIMLLSSILMMTLGTIISNKADIDAEILNKLTENDQS